MYRIGIDIGGTNIAAGLVDEALRIVDRVSVKTHLPTTPELLQEKAAAAVWTLLERNGISKTQVRSVGVGVPCTANGATGEMEDASHLGFERGPLAKPLQERLGIPVAIGNDANAAAWGEYKTCGYDADSFVLITLGTGIGGGIILADRLWSGINYAAGELGHMVIHAGGARCCCGRRGCFEAYASATALIAQAKERMKQDPDTLLWQLCGGRLDGVEAKTVFDGAAQKDPASLVLLDAYTGYLAEGIANIINIFQPAVLCIGGGVSAAGEALLGPVREKVAPMIYTRNCGINTQIMVARLGNDAGIIGAAML